MTDCTFEDLSKLKEIACITIKNNNVQIKELKELLDKGIERSVASRIINEIWGGDTREGIMVKTRLFNEFPKENGDVIKYARFNTTAKAHFAELVNPVFSYFKEVTGFIEQEVDQIMTRMKGLDLTNEMAMFQYNDFRKEVMRYIGALSWGGYLDEKVIVNGKYESWKEVPIDSSCIEQGDYLFLDCFKDKLVKCHKEGIMDQFEKQSTEYRSLSNFSWKNERMEVQACITLLFAKYICGFSK